MEKNPLPIAWPQTGTIEFYDYGLQYRKGLDWALKGISLRIEEREKVSSIYNPHFLEEDIDRIPDRRSHSLFYTGFF